MHELDTLDPSSSSPFGAPSSRQPHQHPASSSPALRNMPHLSDDPFADLRTPKAAPPPPPAAKAREPAVAALPPPPPKAVVDKRYDDPWADILEDPAVAKKSKSTKAGKGKGKGKEVDVGGGEGRKRSLSTAAYEEDEGLAANSKRGKVSRRLLTRSFSAPLSLELITDLYLAGLNGSIDNERRERRRRQRVVENGAETARDGRPGQAPRGQHAPSRRQEGLDCRTDDAYQRDGVPFPGPSSGGRRR